MTIRPMLAALSTTLALALTTGCVSSSSSGGGSGLSGDVILTLEDARGDLNAQETLTLLNLPLPGLGGDEDEVVEWSQLETRATSDWSASPVSVDSRRGLALIAGESGVTLVRTDGVIEPVGSVETSGAISSVSLAGDGTGVALSEDGATLHVLRATRDALEHTGEFPIAMALGEGGDAYAALLNQHAQLAVLDEGRSRLVLFSLAKDESRGVVLEQVWKRSVGAGVTGCAWTRDGRTLVVGERMLADDLARRVEVHVASGRVSFYPADGGDPVRATLPGRPSAVAVNADGSRICAVLDRSGGQALALIARERRDATLLDIARLDDRAAGAGFDAAGRHLLVALPEVGSLGVWRVDASKLIDTGLFIDTGPGVSAVAVAGE